MKIFICAVRLAIQVDENQCPEDAVTALLSEQLFPTIATSCLLDWEYDYFGDPVEIEVGDEYGLDSGVPQLPNRFVDVV